MEHVRVATGLAAGDAAAQDAAAEPERPLAMLLVAGRAVHAQEGADHPRAAGAVAEGEVARHSREHGRIPHERGLAGDVPGSPGRSVAESRLPGRDRELREDVRDAHGAQLEPVDLDIPSGRPNEDASTPCQDDPSSSARSSARIPVPAATAASR